MWLAMRALEERLAYSRTRRQWPLTPPLLFNSNRALMELQLPVDHWPSVGARARVAPAGLSRADEPFTRRRALWRC